MSEPSVLAGLAAIRQLVFIKTAAEVKRAAAAHAHAECELAARQAQKQTIDLRHAQIVETTLKGGSAMKLVACQRYCEFLKSESVAAGQRQDETLKELAHACKDLELGRIRLAQAAARVRLAEDLCQRARRAKRVLAETKEEDGAVEAWVQKRKEA